MKTRTPNDESQKRGAEYWQRHQSLVARVGGVVPYMRGGVPRRQTQTEPGKEPPAPPADDPLLKACQSKIA